MENQVTTTLNNLPDELITLILINNEPRDIVSFGATCKQFHELVSYNDYLWKKKYSEIVPSEIVRLFTECTGGHWHEETVNFYKLKHTICMELVSMPPKYYWSMRELTLANVDVFFTLATNNNFNYYYTIYILQEILKKGSTVIDSLRCLKPLYTLTTMYYAKIVLRYLLHTYLAMKWVQQHTIMELPPIFVTTFFLQWIDVTNIYTCEDVESRIQLLVTRVEEVLQEPEPKPTQQFDRQQYTEIQILHAITKVIYSNYKVSDTAGSRTFNIVKILDENIPGNVISFGTIYQAVATSFGLKVELIAFPNHLFLEWKSSEIPRQLYTINVFNGEIKPKRSCPFSHGRQISYEYRPESLLQFIYQTYMNNKGHYKNCKIQNALYLWDIFGNYANEQSPYMNFYLYLIKRAHSPGIRTNLNLTFLEDVHLEMIIGLSSINGCPEPVYKTVVIKKHHNSVRYAVGMLCLHVIHNYVCVITGWEVDGHHLSIQGVDDLPCKDQPFYCVTALDQSERYVAQENLQMITAPFRIHTSEDCLAKEFTHFDGFSYIPNDEKLLEYPEEQPYIEALKKSIV